MTQSANQPPIIVTDAACDLPADVIESYGIHVAPLTILFGDEAFRSGIDITPDEFYRRLSESGVHPTTSQPTAAEFADLYRRLAAENQPVLSIHLSEGLSGTVNAARQAARNVPEMPVTVHDSGTLTSALGLQVLVAARAAKAGYSVEQILPLLAQTHETGGMLFTVDDLSYLHRGGRIGSVRYQLGQILHIKPIITVAKTGPKVGTYIQAGRARSMAKAVDAFVAQIVEHVGAGNKLRAISLYGDSPELAEQLNRRLAETFECVYLEMMPTAPVLGVHVGPKALGVGYAAGDWPV